MPQDSGGVTHSDILMEVAKVGVSLQHHTVRIEDHEMRMRKLEDFKAKIAGYAMAGAAIGSVVVQILLGMIK